MSAEQQLHQIGVVAERVDLSLRTIRHYEEVGLVVPSGRSVGGFRLYTDADILRLEQVKVMKPLGFTLEETTEILELRDARAGGELDSSGLERLRGYATRAEERVLKLRRQLDQAHSFATAIRGDADGIH